MFFFKIKVRVSFVSSFNLQSLINDAFKIIPDRRCNIFLFGMAFHKIINITTDLIFYFKNIKVKCIKDFSEGGEGHF